MTKKDFNEDTKRFVRENGFACAFTMTEGINDINQDRFDLMRLAPIGEFNSYFVAEVAGLVSLKQKMWIKAN